MPRVVKRKARKAYPEQGIEKGEEYYYWKIKLARGGLTRRSKTYPKPSQLNLGFTGQLGDLQESLSAASDLDGLRGVAEEIRELGGEQQEKFDNMPDGLQQGDTGQLLEERASALESWADEIEQACNEYESKLDEIDNQSADDLGLEADATEDEIEQAREDAKSEAFDELKNEVEGGCSL